MAGKNCYVSSIVIIDLTLQSKCTEECYVSGRAVLAGCSALPDHQGAALHDDERAAGDGGGSGSAGGWVRRRQILQDLAATYFSKLLASTQSSFF